MRIEHTKLFFLRLMLFIRDVLLIPTRSGNLASVVDRITFKCPNRITFTFLNCFLHASHV